MKNYWLDRNQYTEVQITQRNDYSLDTLFYGKWTVSRYSKRELEEHKQNNPFPSDDSCALQQMASGNSPDIYYLHKDGTWVKNSTYKDYDGFWTGKFKDECWTGYFDTKEDAEATLKNAEGIEADIGLLR